MRRDRLTLCLIVAMALGLRLWMLQLYRPLSPWVAAQTLTDAEMGRNLLAGRGWVGNLELIEKATRAQAGRNTMVDLADLLPVDDGRPGAFVAVGSAHSPGYSTWFALSYWLGGDVRYLYSQRMQAALDAAACLLLFGIGRILWSGAAGLIAAAIYALWPAPAFLANLTVAASTDSFWFIAVSYGAAKTWQAVARRATPWVGVLIAAAGAFGGACMNSTSFVLPAVCGAVAMAAAVFDRRALKVAAAMVAAQLLVAVLLTPWALRNQRLYGQFSFVRGTFWQLAWASFGELPNPWGLGFDDKYYWNWIDENCAGCDGGERERAVREQILSDVVLSPAFPRHLSNIVKLRLPRLIEVARVPVGAYAPGASAASVNTFSTLLRIADALVPWLFVCAVAGLVVVAARGAAAAPVLVAMGPTLFLTTFSLLFYVELRKTVPGYGFLCVLAGMALAEAGSRALAALRRQHRLLPQRGTRAALAIALASATAAFPVRAAVVAGGEIHSLAMRPAGNAFGWGAGLYGQVGDGVRRTRYLTADASQVRGLRDVIAVAAGGNHSLALTRDGTVWAWGDNLYGELGDGSRTSRLVPVRVAGLTGVIAISAGYLHSVALRSDRTVWAWGNNLHGQLGQSGRFDRLTPVQVPDLRAASVAAGFFHTIAVDERGDVWTWGQNTHGQLGNSRIDRSVPGKVSGVGHVRMAAGGQHHTVALLKDGTVWSWGGNTFGQLGYATVDVQAFSAARKGDVFNMTDAMQRDTDAGRKVQRTGIPDNHEPRQIPGLAMIQQVAAGEDFSLALGTDHVVWAWGDNLYGQLGDGTWDSRTTPVRTTAPDDVTEVAAGYSHVLAVQPDGTVWTWGFGHYGQLGIGAPERRVNRPTKLASFSLAPELEMEGPIFHRFGPEDVTWLSPLGRWTDRQLLLQGTAPDAFVYAAAFRAVKAGPGTPLAGFGVEGEVRTGGVTVGVQVKEQWVFYRNVDQPGPFRVVWTPETEDDYRVVIAHYLPAGDLSTDLQLGRIGWFRQTTVRDGKRVPVVETPPEPLGEHPAVEAPPLRTRPDTAANRLTARDISFLAPIARLENGTLSIKGRAGGRYLYACVLNPARVDPGERRRTLVVRGDLRLGGVTVGVQQNDRWVFQQNVVAPGPFSIEWTVPVAGEYRVVIAHFHPEGDLETDVVIREMAWAPEGSR